MKSKNLEVRPSNKKRVALIALYMPGIYPPGDDSVPMHFLAPLYIKAVVEADPQISEQYDVRVFDLPTTWSEEQIVEEIAAYKPDILGYSLYVWNYEMFVATSKVLKQMNPNLNVILGGPQVGDGPVEILQENPQADIIIVGDGESRFLKLLECNMDVAGLAKIPKIAYREANGEPVFTGGEHKEDLTKIPSPFQSGAIDLNNEAGHTVIVETYRGCPFTCNYCVWGDFETKLNLFPMEQVLGDIDVLYNNPNVKTVVFADACLFYTRERAKLIIDKIASCKYKIPTFLSLDILVVNEEMVHSLKKVHFHENSYNFGLQSTNSETLDLAGRKAKQELFIKKVAIIREIDPDAEISFDLLYGLPGDNYELFRETVEFALSLSVRKVYFSNLILLPGTTYWDDRDKHGISYGTTAPYVVGSTKTYPLDEMKQTRVFAMMVLHILYAPPIRDMIYKMVEYNPKLRRVELIDKYSEIMSKYINPFDGVNLDILSISANNLARRKVFNLLSLPSNCLISYKCAVELLQFFKLDHLEDLNQFILLGQEYYESVCSYKEEETERNFLDKHDSKDIQHIKYKWRVSSNGDSEPSQTEELAEVAI
jgi:radical SAM superfamily enzyme YgiQ (UPF0313 family)